MFLDAIWYRSDNNDKLNRGTVFRKFNNTLLHDTEYVNLMKKTINDCKSSVNNYTDKGLVWELIRLKIRSVSIPYCIKKKKNM